MNVVEEKNVVAANVELEKEINDLECLLVDYENMFAKNYSGVDFLSFQGSFGDWKREIFKGEKALQEKAYLMIQAALEIIQLKKDIKSLKSELSILAL